MYRDQYNRAQDLGEDPGRMILSRIILAREEIKDQAKHYNRMADCPHRCKKHTKGTTTKRITFKTIAQYFNRLKDWTRVFEDTGLVLKDLFFMTIGKVKILLKMTLGHLICFTLGRSTLWLSPV